MRGFIPHSRICLGSLACLCPVLLLLVLGGCALRNSTAIQEVDLQSPLFTESGNSIAAAYWWTAFQDHELNRQIFRAVNKNYSLVAALERVFAARAVARREASDLFIDLDGVLGFDSQFGPGEDSTNYGLGFEVNYQVDLWGEIGSRVDAQRLRADATDATYHAVALTLTANIAAAWFSLIEARAQIELLNEQIETNEVGLKLQEERFGLGLIRSADVLRQRQLLESTREQVVIAKSQVEVFEHQLAVLIGEMPQTATYDTGSQLPDLPPLPATGLPSDLIQRRPDVRSDFLDVQAADRDLASAISAQYPRLNLTGSLLNVAENSETLLQDFFVSVGAQLIAPLFDGGQRRAEVDRTCAVKRELFNEYYNTVLIAFSEVEDALAREKYQLLRIDRLEKQVDLAGRASDQLREQYLIGDEDYLDVLSAITGQQSLQRQLLSQQLELRLIRVSLYLALAGDFEISTNSAPFLPAQLAEEVLEEPQELEETADAEEVLEKQETPKPEQSKPEPLEPLESVQPESSRRKLEEPQPKRLESKTIKKFDDLDSLEVNPAEFINNE